MSRASFPCPSSRASEDGGTQNVYLNCSGPPWQVRLAK